MADTFDAVTSSRAYHGSRKHRRALDVISEESGSRLDPDVVAGFLRYYTGRRSVAWSALGPAGSPRLGNWVGGLLSGGGGLPTPLAQSFVAIMVAALAGASLGGQPATAASEPASQGAGGSVPDRAARDGSGRAAGGRAEGTPVNRQAPVGDRSGSRPRPDALGDGSPGGPAPQGEPGGTAPEGPAPPPNVQVPSVDVPGVELPDVKVPDIEVPGLEVPGLEVPGLEVPGLEVPGLEVPGLGVPAIEVPTLEVPLPSALPDLDRP